MITEQKRRQNEIESCLECGPMDSLPHEDKKTFMGIYWPTVEMAERVKQAATVNKLTYRELTNDWIDKNVPPLVMSFKAIDVGFSLSMQKMQVIIENRPDREYLFEDGTRILGNASYDEIEKVAKRNGLTFKIDFGPF